MRFEPTTIPYYWQTGALRLDHQVLTSCNDLYDFLHRSFPTSFSLHLYFLNVFVFLFCWLFLFLSHGS